MDLAKLMYMPLNASAHGHEIDWMMYAFHIFMLVLLIGWGAFFTIALIKFRKGKHPNADYTGVKSHISTYLEVGVVVFEAILLIGFSIPFWARQVNAFPNRTDTLELKVIAEQFAWNIHYPGEDGIFGKTDAKFFNKQTNPLGIDPDDPYGKDDIHTINQLHLPIGRPVIIHLTSRDVMHSFGIPVMRVKQDVIPGMSIPTWFTPTKVGNWEIACAQLCGIGHYRMKGYVTVHKPEDYEAWISEQSASKADEAEYDSFWN